MQFKDLMQDKLTYFRPFEYVAINSTTSCMGVAIFPICITLNPFSKSLYRTEQHPKILVIYKDIKYYKIVPDSIASRFDCWLCQNVINMNRNFIALYWLTTVLEYLTEFESLILKENTYHICFELVMDHLRINPMLREYVNKIKLKIRFIDYSFYIKFKVKDITYFVWWLRLEMNKSNLYSHKSWVRTSFAPVKILLLVMRSILGW